MPLTTYACILFQQRNSPYLRSLKHCRLVPTFSCHKRKNEVSSANTFYTSPSAYQFSQCSSTICKQYSQLFNRKCVLCSTTLCFSHWPDLSQCWRRMSLSGILHKSQQQLISKLLQVKRDLRVLPWNSLPSTKHHPGYIKCLKSLSDWHHTSQCIHQLQKRVCQLLLQ